MKQLLVLMIAIYLTACSGGGGSTAADVTEHRWDSMEWNQGAWQ